MNIKKNLGIAGLIFATTFLSIKGTSQDKEDEKMYNISFKEPLFKEQFFTKEYIEYLDNLKNTIEQKDKFIFKGVENKQGTIVSPGPFGKVIILRRNFYLNEIDRDNQFYVNLEFFEKKDGFVGTNYNVIGINKYGEKKDIPLCLKKLKREGIVNGQGYRKSKKAYKREY